MKTKGGDGMNDKQKEIALKMAVVRARMSLEYLDTKDYIPLKKELAELLTAYDAISDPPKRKPTTADIKVEDDEGFRRVWCREYGWTDRGWVWRVSHVYSPLMAEIIRAGLVATGNVPEVGE